MNTLFKFLEEYWHTYRRKNTPDAKLMGDDDAQKDSNEKLLQLYKDAADKKNTATRVQSTFHEVVKQSSGEDLKTKFVPLKVKAE